jgi:hypothetical protein
MFAWLSSVWKRPAIDVAAEQNADNWLKSGMQGKPPVGATTTHAFRFEPIRSQAAQLDPTTTRRFGEL